jgi:hypothetical protein
MKLCTRRVLFLAGLFALGGCDAKKEAERYVTSVRDVLERREAFERATDGGDTLPPTSDLAALRELVWLPAGVGKCRWFTVFGPGAHSRVPGPTDYTVFAYVELLPSGWAELGEAMTGEPKRGPVRADIARLLLQDNPTLRADADGEFTVMASEISGSRIRGLGVANLDDVERIGDGLFLALSTR